MDMQARAAESRASSEVPAQPLGAAAAAFLAAGIGTAAYGLFVTLAEVSTRVKGLLNWWDPVGPLSGKTSMGVLVWLAAWLVLHRAWKNKSVDFGKIYTWSLVLIGVGLVGTFPTFFEMFSH